MKLEHCDFDDPECCEKCKEFSGTAYYKAVPGTQHCPRHCGHAHKAKIDQKAANQYRVQVWQKRLNDFSGSDHLKTLSSEIGVLRLLLEETLGRCSDKEDLLMFSARIQSITTDLQKLVTASERLERNLGEMMDRPTALKFAGRLIEIVSKHVDDSDAIDRISEDILDAMQ